MDPELKRYSAYESEPVLFTTRLPSELQVQLKLRAIRSTLQILTEHAYLLYLGGRLPPRLLAGETWPEEFPNDPRPEYMLSPVRPFSVRIPRSLLRWARVFAAEADISEQHLASRVFEWYVRTARLPPNREDAERDWRGFLKVPEKLIAWDFEGLYPEQALDALQILIDRQAKYGGPLASKPDTTSPPLRVPGRTKRRRRLGSEGTPSRVKKGGGPKTVPRKGNTAARGAAP